MAVPYEKLLSIGYYYGGGMEDTSVSRMIKKDEAGQFCLIAEDHQGGRYYDLYKLYRVEDSLIRELEEYIQSLENRESAIRAVRKSMERQMACVFNSSIQYELEFKD